MKSNYFYLLLVAVILSSCSMNFLFLFPRNLKQDKTFQIYDDEKEDTLNLKFVDQNTPDFYYSKTGKTELEYTIENCYYPNTNGDSLNSWIMRPNAGSNGQTIFFLHGNAGNLVYNYQLAEPFVKRGYKVFLIDYSEFGFSQGKATRKNVLIDANSSLDFLLSLDEFKDEKIIIYGQSYGAHLAVVVGQQNQSKISGIVVEGGFSNHKDVAATRASFLGRLFVAEQYSAIDSIPMLKKPVLFIHSLKDKTVKIKLGRKLYEAANEPKEFYQIDCGHIRGPLFYADSIVAKMERLF